MANLARCMTADIPSRPPRHRTGLLACLALVSPLALGCGGTEEFDTQEFSTQAQPVRRCSKNSKCPAGLICRHHRCVPSKLPRNQVFRIGSRAYYANNIRQYCSYPSRQAMIDKCYVSGRRYDTAEQFSSSVKYFLSGGGTCACAR